MAKLKQGSISIALQAKKENAEPFRLFCEKQGDVITAMLPIKTYSEANGGPKKKVMKKGRLVYKVEHWAESNRRHKKQKAIVHMMLGKFRRDIKLPCLVTLTRYAPNSLDKFDNLPMAFKWILDAICEVITGDLRAGRADGTIEDGLDVKYDQVRHHEYGVKIQIAF